jgi:hypothetical protein
VGDLVGQGRVDVDQQMHGRVRALRIETFQPSDLVLPSSTVLAINALINRASGQPAARILDRMVELPLEELLEHVQAVRSGRR